MSSLPVPTLPSAADAIARSFAAFDTVFPEREKEARKVIADGIAENIADGAFGCGVNYNPHLLPWATEALVARLNAWIQATGEGLTSTLHVEKAPGTENNVIAGRIGWYPTPAAIAAWAQRWAPGRDGTPLVPASMPVLKAEEKKDDREARRELFLQRVEKVFREQYVSPSTHNKVDVKLGACHLTVIMVQDWSDANPFVLDNTDTVAAKLAVRLWSCMRARISASATGTQWQLNNAQFNIISERDDALCVGVSVVGVQAV